MKKLPVQPQEESKNCVPLTRSRSPSLDEDFVENEFMLRESTSNARQMPQSSVVSGISSTRSKRFAVSYGGHEIDQNNFLDISIATQ